MNFFLVLENNTIHKKISQIERGITTEKKRKTTTQHDITLHDLFMCTITLTLANTIHVA